MYMLRVRPRVPSWPLQRVLTSCGTDESYRRATTISMLPENVLLEIFYIYSRNPHHSPPPVWKWHLFVHVCQIWRQIVFASPHRLNLEILCTHKTPVRKNLGIWPAFPIVINYCYSGRSTRPKGEGNVIAALKYPGRVGYVRLDIKGSQLGKVAKVMQVPFPVLTRSTFTRTTEMHRSFLLDSWGDLHHV